MRRISILIFALTLSAGPILCAQDAATAERLNQLAGQIEDLIAANKAQQKQIADLSRQIENLREQASKPTASYASPDDLKRLAEQVKEVDRKRMEDYDKIHADLLKLGKTLSAPVPKTTRSAPVQKEKEEAANTEKSDRPEKVFEYEIQSGDTLSAIVAAYREKNIKITSDQILKANPGLKPEKMRPGQKIVIPAPSN
jgi:LysM repeat protein